MPRDPRPTRAQRRLIADARAGRVVMQSCVVSIAGGGCAVRPMWAHRDTHRPYDEGVVARCLRAGYVVDETPDDPAQPPVVGDSDRKRQLRVPLSVPT